MKTIVMTGGGSAGHVTPNLAIMPLLTGEGRAIHYIGTVDGIERGIIEGEGIPYTPISAGKLRRYFSVKNFTDVFRILKGYFQSKRALKEIEPELVFSKGGFVTVPVVFAAHRLGIPVVLHDSDYSPGLANKLCIPRADKVCVSFDAAASHVPKAKCVVTGSPVRQELFCGSREAGLELLGFSGDKPVLLIMGGSLGAQAINDAVDGSIGRLTALFDIVHIRGNGKLNYDMALRDDYRQYEYISAELPDVLAASDFVLSRAGANAIFEFLALGLPALLIPLPKEASRGDQILNAAYFEKKGFALVMEQAEVTAESLVLKLGELKARAGELKRNMRESGVTNAAQNVAQVIFSVIESRTGK